MNIYEGVQREDDEDIDNFIQKYNEGKPLITIANKEILS